MDETQTADPNDVRRAQYKAEVQAGYRLGYDLEPLPPERQLGEAFTHGWRLGRNDRNNDDRIQAWKENQQHA